MVKTPWTVTISRRALDDIDQILSQTLSGFGTHQLKVYSGLIFASITVLETEGANTPGLKLRRELGKNVYSLPIARGGKKASHRLYLRRLSAKSSDWIVVRVLHVRMDAARYVR